MTYLLLLQSIRQAICGIFDQTMLQITALGESTITFLLLGFVYWCVDKQAGIYMACNVGAACTYSQFLKGIFKIERPWVQDARITPVEKALANAGGYSFPSGHTVRAASNWGALGIFYRKKKKAVFYAGWIVVLAVAFSRNYLGVHTSWDILGALALSGVTMWIIAWVLRWSKGGRNRDVLICLTGCLLCFLPMLKAGCLSNAGAGMGVCIGWILERRLVKFPPCKNNQERLLRFSIGAFGIVVIQTAVASVLGLWMASKYAGFFTSFFLMLFITVLYPFFFSRKKRYGLGILACLILFLGMCAAVGIKKENPDQQGTEKPVIEEEKKQEESEITEQPEEQGKEEKEYVRPVIIAHRGYSSQFPENTLASFAGAVAIGADMIELDVQLSKDGVLMVYHDGNLEKLGVDGSVADYTYEELRALDVGGAFMPDFSGEKMPALEEVLNLIRETDLEIYLELKDIGEAEGFEEAVLSLTDALQMTQRCIFASFNMQYLSNIKAICPYARILANVSSYDSLLPQQIAADYYGLYLNGLTQEVVDAIHAAGRKAFVWTVNTPRDMETVCSMGADGIVTNYPGTAKIAVEPQYDFLTSVYERSFAVPGLYGARTSEICENMVVQGMTCAEDYILISAYSKSEENSVLYVLDMSGKWLTTFNLGFRAHTGGIAYDNTHGMVWITGAEGSVCAMDWKELSGRIASGTKEGLLEAPEILCSFDAELINHNGSKVASFLDIVNDRLYVGSYTIGCCGMLRGYDISLPLEPRLVTEQSIPEKIQGMTAVDGKRGKYLLFSQSAQTDDAALLVYDYDESAESYQEALRTYLMPEGLEQPETAGDKVMLLFESAALPYRETARIRNDQVYVVDLSQWVWENVD